MRERELKQGSVPQAIWTAAHSTLQSCQCDRVAIVQSVTHATLSVLSPIVERDGVPGGYHLLGYIYHPQYKDPPLHKGWTPESVMAFITTKGETPLEEQK